MRGESAGVDGVAGVVGVPAGVDGVAGVDDVAAKRPRGPPRTSRSLAGLDAGEGSNFKRFCSPAVEDGLLAAFGDDGAGRCEVSRPSSQPC